MQIYSLTPFPEIYTPKAISFINSLMNLPRAFLAHIISHSVVGLNSLCLYERETQTDGDMARSRHTQEQ